eukprot:COSAG02_NODE_1220_length_13807_cov_6.303254_7_plen_112_part_00
MVGGVPTDRRASVPDRATVAMSRASRIAGRPDRVARDLQTETQTSCQIRTSLQQTLPGYKLNLKDIQRNQQNYICRIPSENSDNDSYMHRKMLQFLPVYTRALAGALASMH